MAGSKPKFYVVWSGREPGIYTTWEACRAQTQGVAGACYKAYPTREAAEQAYAAGKPSWHVRTAKPASSAPAPAADRPVAGWAVDAACSGNPGKMEYRGVDLTTGQVIFQLTPIWGTNNLGEFLAIVHALALLTQSGRRDVTVYSDSRNALLWVRKRKAATKLARDARSATVYNLVERAEAWLQAHPAHGIKIEKWHTDRWGEIPADFGRK